MPTSRTPARDTPQRSTRAPAEGAPESDDSRYDASPADGGGSPAQRSPRAPAEGAPDEQRADDEPERNDAEAWRSDVAGSGNSLGDGRTAGGAANAAKRDQLKG